MEQTLSAINILFDATGREQLGSYRIPFVAVRDVIASRKDCRVVSKSESIEPDVVFCLAGQGRVQINKLKFPFAKIVLFKPHHENTLFLTPFKNPYKTISEIYSFLKDRRNRDKLNSDIAQADYLIADSRKLKQHFDSIGYKSHFMRLMERVTIRAQSPKTLDFDKGNITVLFHGSTTHYTSNVIFINSILRYLSQRSKVLFLCMMNQASPSHKINIHNVDVKYYDYDYNTLIDLISKTDLGLVPNFIYPRRFLNGIFGQLLFFGSYQEKAEAILQKQSSNAGRAYLFAHYGVPFLAHPTNEILMDFCQIKGLCFPSDAQEAAYFCNELLENRRLYEDISAQLLTFSDHHNLDTEVEKLLCLLKTVKDNKH
ncbi:hypothetical protein N9D90_01010 [Alphaproteobacteria bacterium]|nr:hypothetical protein [Alphaproteobacteria bacterium]